MKLLIDQNISHRIIQKIASAYPDAIHVKDLGLNQRSDPEIFMLARKESYEAIVTLDEDFFHLLQRHGTPPKIIWVRTGNCSTPFFSKLIGREEKGDSSISGRGTA